MVSDTPFGTDMASVVITVDEDYDPMNGLEVCLDDLQSTNTQTSPLTLERTRSSEAHYINLTYESLSELYGTPSNLDSDTNGAALMPHCEC